MNFSLGINPAAIESYKLSLGLIFLIVAAVIDIILAFLVYRANRKSATNIIFSLLSVCTVLWLAAAYIVQVPQFATSIFLVRLGIFFAAPMSALFFLLAHTLPSEKLRLSRSWLWAVIAATMVMMAVNISPYAFTGVSTKGGSLSPVPGLGIAPFAILSTLFSVLAVVILARRYRKAAGDQKGTLRLVLLGIVLMLVLVIGTVLVPILVFHSGFFVAFTPLYTLLFLGMAAYAIVTHRLFNVKVIATEGLTVVIWVLLFSKILSPSALSAKIVDSLIFIATLTLGVVLIKSVRREVEQREQLERLTEELKKANDELESLSRFKTRLISLASHQMKAPLAAIKGFGSILVEGIYGPVSEKVKETIIKMQNSANGLIDLINTLLDTRKVEEGRMEYAFTRVSLTAMMKTVIEELRPLASRKGLELSLKQTAPGDIFVNADPKLKQVVQNLIDNAVKYTLHGFVRVEIQEIDHEALLSVADAGLGIARAVIPHLFQEFVRDEAIKKQIHGTGLGLYIARKIIEAHKGTIWAESAGEGKGSVFYVRLPAAGSVTA